MTRVIVIGAVDDGRDYAQEYEVRITATCRSITSSRDNRTADSTKPKHSINSGRLRTEFRRQTKDGVEEKRSINSGGN